MYGIINIILLYKVKIYDYSSNIKWYLNMQFDYFLSPVRQIVRNDTLIY